MPTTAPHLDRHTGARALRFICLPGLVPDGPETFARQLPLLRALGSVVIVTYPYEAFDLDAVIAAVEDEIAAATTVDAAPILVGLSVGGGIAIELLRRAAESGRRLPLAGVVLVSPMSCVGDLSSMLERLMRPILEESTRADGRPEDALERGRQLFRTLVTRSAGDGVPHAALRWLGPLHVLTPQGFAAWRERRLVERIQLTLERMPAHGAVARVLALPRLRGLAGLRGPLCTAPTLILWGSKERQTLDMDGPGSGRLCRPDLACKVFPDCEVQWIYDRDGGEVPHASLLKHAHAFNPVLSRWLRRQARAGRPGALRSGARRIAALLPAALLAAQGRGVA